MFTYDEAIAERFPTIREGLRSMFYLGDGS